MRRLGIPEVLALEHTSDDLPDAGIEFHLTRELAPPQQANRALAELWINDRAGALEVAHWLGDCTARIESLDWCRVPRANSPQRSAGIGVQWRRPQYGQLLARADCPAWAREFIGQVSGTLSRADAFDSFGGWGGELLQAPDRRFVLIDWPGLGAAPRGSLAAVGLEVLLRFGAADPAPLVERFGGGFLTGARPHQAASRSPPESCSNKGTADSMAEAGPLRNDAQPLCDVLDVCSDHRR